MTELTTFLARAGRLAGGRPALIYGGRPVSYAEIEGESRRVAAGLRGLGIGRGDRVCLWMPNAPAYLAMFFACARIGAIAVAVNTRFRSAEVGDIVGRSGAKVLMLWPGFKGIAFQDILAEIDPAQLEALEHLIVYAEDEAEFRSPLPGTNVVGYTDLASADAMNHDHADPSLGVAIFTTSGTTKAPKFVLHDQASIANHGIEVAERFGWRAEGTMLLQSLPLCGVFGLSQIMAGLASGHPTVLMPYHDTEEAVRLMREHRVTHTAGSDEMFNMMLQSADGARPFPHFRWGVYANFNAALDNIAETAEARGVRLCGVYGMSEVQALFARWPETTPVAVRKRGGGIPTSPKAAVRVRDTETGELLPPGQAGELECRGPSQMREYFLNEEATRETITADGFIRTGDLAELTEDGGFFFLSRMGDVLRLGGFLVAPAEIEARVMEHPSVADVQVVGVTAGGRNRPVAFVVPAEPGRFDEQAVIGHCAAGLAKFKVPARVIALAAFPTTMSANGVKIQKNKLREMAKAATADDPA